MSGAAPSGDDVLGADWPARTGAGVARRAAVAALASVAADTTGLVEYASSGRVLIIGPEPSALAAVESLAATVHCTVLVRESGRASPPGPVVGARVLSGDGARSVPVVAAELASIAGHLGAFAIQVRDGERSIDLTEVLEPGAGFDLVLDLGRQPLLADDLTPPGYFAPGGDHEAYAAAIQALPALVGEYQKPVYVAYSPDICAHGERGLTGCTRCLDACPSGALASIGERIALDAHLCHGAGTCATVCPTGALRYAYPGPRVLHERLRRLLGAYREAGERDATVLFVGAEAGAETVIALAPELPEQLLPVVVEEVGAVGLETWLTAIAYGAAAVRLLIPPATPASVAATIEAQLVGARAILAGLGLSGGAVAAFDATGAAGAPPVAPGEPARYLPADDKRTAVRLALDHLYAQAESPRTEVALPAGMPFGEVRVDTGACTLCMACTAVCPTRALSAGGESPRLDFTEWSCVQCGLCRTACPERAISLAPRLILDPELRRRQRSLHEEPPFECVSCGKPFATRSVIERMVERLGSHRMFAGDAIERLRMCEDCRVKDMFRDEQPFE